MNLINDFEIIILSLPRNTPKARIIINGRRLPNFDPQRSLRLPKIGVTKNPTSGLNAQTNVMC